MSMNAKLTRPHLVEKEDVALLKFPKGDVLPSPELQRKRNSELLKAIKLGNNQKRKVKIDFEDSEGFKRTETTIWAVTENNILLKSGIHIPIERIHTVSPY